jgi:predicted DNA-binding transcriptional regulator AlpA
MSRNIRARVFRTPRAAQYLGVRPSFLEKLRWLGGGPTFVRLGVRAVGYRVDDLERWLDERRQEPK